MLDAIDPPRFETAEGLTRTMLPALRTDAPPRVHILIPTSLQQTDVAALLLGMRIAVSQPHLLTVLHVVAPDQQPGPPRGGLGLDALQLLHEAADFSRWRSPRLDQKIPADEGRRRISAFLEAAFPARVLQRFDVRVECRTGDVAETVARVADEQAADVVIMTNRPKRRWWPVMPGCVRRVLKLTRRQVVVVRGVSGEHNRGSQATGGRASRR